MAVVDIIDRYAAVTRARLADAEQRRFESRPAGGDSKFAEMLEEAMASESSGPYSSEGDNLDLLRQDFRHQMISTMLNHIEKENVPSRVSWRHLPPPDSRESEKAPSNYRQGEVLSDATGAADAMEEIIERAARRFGVEPSLIKSVIQVESNFNSGATSPKGAMGLMQLMPVTASDLGVTRPYDPEENIMGGTRYLKMLLNRYGGNLEKVLAAYNWGMGNLENRPEKMPAETRSYVARVLQHYGQMKV